MARIWITVFFFAMLPSGALGQSANRAAQASTVFELKPNESVPSLLIPEDVHVDLLLQEPAIANPLYLDFDERGRLWLVQYRQYPWPAGLRLVSRDNVWRNVYEPPVPPPPPHDKNSPFRGSDRITIHEDTDGDGRFDSQKTFLEGLNLATAALKGRGGVFVMNPPYLLFYADRDNDDRPDSLQPKILLSGFGIEDTHSIANSLRWGPDGWIYGTQGSTVSAAVVRHRPDGQIPAEEAPVHSMGQHIWRYHPERHEYEIFAEGGGNAFGVEFDSQGRVYSGHNGGDTRGFHYVQGGFYLKNFGKHGSLSSPYAFGFYGAMSHHAAERFTHTFEIYEATALPTRYHGLLLGVAPNLHYTIASRIADSGTSRHTHDEGVVMAPAEGERDNWFTPVDIQTGPDGAIYVADWYSVQPNHYLNHEGQTNPDLGRVYRLRGHQYTSARINLGALSSRELIQYLSHENRWFREMSLRLLADRRDVSVIPRLYELATDSSNPFSLQAVWALNVCGGLTERVASELVSHPNARVREWTVRLIGDRDAVPILLAERFAELAHAEPDIRVRLQLACTAKRLSAEKALPILSGLVTHSSDADDVFIPRMIWWAVEAQADDRPAVLAWLRDSRIWTSPVASSANVIENLMRRYAMAGSQQDLQMCASLLNAAPDEAQTRRLISGFMKAYEGRGIPSLPTDLVQALSKTEGQYAEVLGIRRRDTGAIDRALISINNPDVAEENRVELLRALSEVQADPERSVRTFLDLLATGPSEDLTIATLMSLQRFDREVVAAGILDLYADLSGDARETAHSVLASRAAWARQLIQAVQSGRVGADQLNQDTLDRLRFHDDPKLQESVSLLFPVAESSDDLLDSRISLIEKIVSQGNGRPIEGRRIFHERTTCGKCHRMFEQGGDIGPDLTSYNRSNLRLMLLAIINPSAEIREGYQNMTIATDDGQVLTGFIVDENEQILVLRCADGQGHSIQKKHIEEQVPNRLSLMPENLLDGLTDDQLRDLFAFLSSTTPPY